MYQNSNQRFTKRQGAQTRGNRNPNQERRSNFAHDFQSKNPEIFSIASFIRRNNEIARHVSLAIILALRKQGKIHPESTVYVSFYINRFSVKVDGLATEYLYSDPFFMKAFLASAKSIAVYYNKLANDYCCANFNEPFKESIFNTEEVQKEITDMAINVIEHITDSKVVVEPTSEEEEKKETKKK